MFNVRLADDHLYGKMAIHLAVGSGGGVVDNTPHYQSGMARSIPRFSRFSDKLSNRSPVYV